MTRNNNKDTKTIKITINCKDDNQQQLYSIFDIADILEINREDIAEMVYAPELNKIRSGLVDYSRLLSFLNYHNHEEPF